MSQITIMHPFANFYRFREWGDLVTPYLLKDYLEKHNIKASTIDFNNEFSDIILGEKFKKRRLEEATNRVILDEKKENIEDVNSYIRNKAIKKIIEETEDSELKQLISTNERFYFHYCRLINLFKDDSTEKDMAKAVSNLEETYRQSIQKLSISPIVAITIPTKQHLDSGIILSRIIKEKNPQIKTVFGGAFIKLQNEERIKELSEKKEIDFIIKGNEDELLQTVQKILENKEVNPIQTEKLGDNSINNLILKTDYSDKANIVLTKGCYWGRCHYCDYVELNGCFIKNLKIVIEEIEYWYSKGKRKFNMITDSLPPVYAEKIAQAIIDKNLDLEWECKFTKLDKLWTYERIKLVKESGFRFDKTGMGIDSYVEKTLNLMEKGYDKKIIDEFMSNIRKAKVIIGRVNIIVDLPGTTYKSFQENEEFLIKNIDIIKDIGIFSYWLTTTCKVGRNPDSYGITPKNESYNLVRDDRTYISKWITDKERELAFRRGSRLRNIAIIGQQYPLINKQKLARINLYNENKETIKVQAEDKNCTIDLLFDSTGKKVEEPITLNFPTRMFPSIINLLYKDFINIINKRKSISINEIINEMKIDNPIKKIKETQRIFQGIIELATDNFFKDINIR